MINIDLCFVPEQHVVQQKLPAVSGSSGHLVIERVVSAVEPHSWPGKVFGAVELSFETAMQQYLQATQDRQGQTHAPKNLQVEAPTRWRQEWEARAERHQVLQQRQQEDLDWRAAKASFRQAKQAYSQLPKSQRQALQSAWQAEQAAWKLVKEQRKKLAHSRQQENQAWHERNQQRKPGQSVDPQQRNWIAVLVVTDNCTRLCLGLPLFRSGAKVTSREVTEALHQLLPAELQFLISDQGKHFKSQWMAQLAQEEGFVHVLIYRHRPQTNGIAERFVLTLKDWLRSQSWQSAEELGNLLARFQPEYNDRPHQGLPIPGLSPREFSNRIWLM